MILMMLKTLAPFTFLFLLSFSYAQNNFSYIGRVLEGGSQQPLQGVIASIEALGITDTTDAEGIFRFDRLAKGRQEIRLELKGYRVLTQGITIDGRSRYLHNFFLEILRFSLPEPVLIASSRNLDLRSSTIDVYTYDQHIFERAPRSSAESLMGTHGVFVAKTDHGGGTPIIRGLKGNQTLLMVDGIRMNHSIYRSGLIPYANTLDPFSIDKIEVSRGSGSVAYGSGALGGVIHFHTQDPEFSAENLQISTRAVVKYGGAYWEGERYDQERTARATFQMSTPRVATILGVSFKNFGELVAGEGLGPQAPSAYQEQDIDFKTKFKFNKHQVTFAWQQVVQDSVGSYEQVSQLQQFDIFQADPRIRLLTYVRYRFQADRPWLQSLTVTPAFQRSTEERDQMQRGANIMLHEREEVQTQSLTLEATTRPHEKWNIRNGAEIYYDVVFSEADEVKANGDSTLLPGRYPDGASMWNLGLFSLHQYTAGKWQFHGGLRYNRVSIEAFDPLLGTLSLPADAWVGNLRSSLELSSDQFLSLSVHTGFRTPNIADWTRISPSDLGIAIPNEQLRPERSTTAELGYHVQKEKLKVSLSAYYTELVDLMDRLPTTFQGSDSLMGQPVFTQSNVGQALVAGIEAQVQAILSPQLSLHTQWTYTYGQTVEDQPQPLRRVPPLFGKVNLRYQLQAFYFVGEVMAAGAQTQLSERDIRDPRIPDGGTLAWTILNAYLGYEFEPFTLALRTENITNQAYRYHGSSVDGYGRSVWLTVQFDL